MIRIKYKVSVKDRTGFELTMTTKLVDVLF